VENQLFLASIKIIFHRNIYMGVIYTCGFVILLALVLGSVDSATCSEKTTEEVDGDQSCGCGSLNRENVQHANEVGSSTSDILTYQTLNSVNNTENAYDGMVSIPSGDMVMGSEDKFAIVADGEGPIRKVYVDSFWMDETEVTNFKFSKFIEETKWNTDAEKFGWSFVFIEFLSPSTLETVDDVVEAAPWWCAVHGADWKHPEGLDSNILTRMDHPVTHVSWNDATAYCKWVNKRLPTEAEWELAARGGLHRKVYPWGNELTRNGTHKLNIWQGDFPLVNTGADGFNSTAPAKSFEANRYGLYNTCGNVWEWVSDWFTKDHQLPTKEKPLRNPSGPKKGEMKVQKGGSYLCHKSYCFRYRVSARIGTTPDSSSGNVGFRCAKDE